MIGDALQVARELLEELRALRAELRALRVEMRGEPVVPPDESY